MTNSPILDDPMNYEIFSFHPFQTTNLPSNFNHKDYFHSLANTIDDPTDPNDRSVGMWFRLMLPPGFDINDANTKYPLILFLHGSGERGTTNYLQLRHGGLRHMNAVLSGEFPGILVYPQQSTPDGGWPTTGENQLTDRAMEIVKKLIKYYNADPNRIYVHGLSGGGQGAWGAMIHYPTLIAAALPMSNAKTEYVSDNAVMAKYVHIPIWLSQGGKDTTPMPTTGNFCVNRLRNYGTSIRYSFMPTFGHGTWEEMYKKPDFFPWMLQHSKTSIHVYYEQSSFCNGEQIPANLKLGVSAGFDGYEWALNNTGNVIASGVNEITATAFGDYYVRIRRGTEWSAWSAPRTIDTSRLPSPPPAITSGSASVTLPALDGSQSVKLSRTDGPTLNYKWYRDNVALQGATNDNYTAAQQGNYTLTARTPATSGVLFFDYWNSTTNRPNPDGILDAYPTEYRAEPLGCESTPSNIIRVTTGNGPNSPLPPKNFFVFSRGLTETELVWDDNSNNETGFEIYRSVDNGNTYELISIQPPSDGSASIRYSDINLLTDNQYCYRIRAVNGDGGSPYSEMVCAATGIDTTPPVTPVLGVAFTTGTSISLAWASSDDVGIAGYDLYRNGLLLTSLTQNTYNNINLTPATSYTYYVIAKDAAGNTSTSNQVTAATLNSGLFYKYYHFDTNLSTVDQIESTTFIKAGKVDNFDISIRERDDRFAFVFEGYINIPTTGSWRFYTTSNAGSRVYIDGVSVFNNINNGATCVQNGTAVSRSLTAGIHNIKVLYYENTGIECLTVSWRLGSGTTVLIPDSAFEDNFSYPTGPDAPSNLTANPFAHNQVNLSWTDNSNDETGFELYRRAAGQSTYQVAGATGQNVQNFQDMGLQPASTYYYKVLAKNNNGFSGQEFTKPSAYLNLNNDFMDVSDNNLRSSLGGSTGTSPTFNQIDKMEGSHALQFAINTSRHINFDQDNVFVRKPFTNRSVAFWIKVSSLTGTQMIYDEGGSTSGFSIRLSGSNLQLGVANGGSRPNISAPFAAYTNTWTHVVGIFKAGGRIELYINKNLVASSQTTFTAFTGITGQDNGCGIGGTNGTNAFNQTGNSFGGLIDNFMFFNDALTQADIDYYYGTDFGYAKAQTPAAPATPAAPSNLTATPQSTSQILLSWNDNSTNELGFEIYRATYNVESSYLLVATTLPDVTTFTDTGLPGNTLFYYRIRAKGAVTNSAFTPPVSASPLNTPPVITTTILDRSVQIGTTLEFEVRATDPDLDVVTFSTDGTWPAFGTVTNIGQNAALVKFDPPPSSGSGAYTLRLSATDGFVTVYSNTFTITVNNNAVPVIATISDQQMKEGNTLTVNISASDDSGNVTLSTVNLPTFATFNYGGSGGTANIVLNPMVSQSGYYGDIQIVANDGQGGIAVESFNLVVEAIETSYKLYLSFDNAPRFEVPWNYIGGTNLQILQPIDIWPISNLFTSNQSATPVTIDAEEINQGGGSFDNTYSFGTIASGGPGLQGYSIIPDDVIKNGLAGAVNQNNKLIINGLEDILSYELNLMSSVKPGYLAGSWTSTIRINGISKTINPVGNATEFQRFVDVRPTNGVIEIEMLASSNNRTMLNAFTLEAYYDDGTLPLAPSDLVLEALSSSSTLVKWNDNSVNETDFDIFRRSEFEQSFSLVGTVNKNIDSLLDQSGIVGTTRYYYYVQARNKNGVANSGIFDVVSSNASPVIVAVNPFTVKTGQKTNISVSASDYENDPISLFFDDLPPFMSFMDHGNGTGTITLDPDESVVNRSFEIDLNARDSKGGTSSRPVIFEVINGSHLQTIYLNLTQPGLLEASNWSNLTSNPATTTSYGGIMDINGSITPVGLTLSGTWTGQAAEGLSYLEEAIFPENVMKTFWFTTGVGGITLTGLDPEFKYNITLFSSTDARGTQTTQGITDYPENNLSITTYTYGTVAFGVDAYKNPNISKKISGIIPDSNGNISFTIQGSGGVRAVLNAIILEKYQTETKPFAPANVVADVITPPYTESTAYPSPFHVELNWVDNSGIETGYEITRYDYSTGISSVVATTSANVQSYKDTNLPRDKKFGYRIRAISPAGVSEFASIADVTIPIYRILLNFNYFSADDVSLNGWNNTSITPDPGEDLSFRDLKNDNNIATSIELNTLAFGTYAGTAFTGVDANGLYPRNATKSYWQLEPGDIDVFEWAGLNDALKYNLVFFGSRITGGVPRNGRGFYTVGSHTVMYNSWNNLNRSIQIKGISPDQGRIEFEATSDGGIPNYCFFNVLELQPYTNFDLEYPTQDFYYYAADDSDINTLANWYSNPDETGGNPVSFNEQGLKYIVTREKQVNLANNLTIGGLSSKMVFKDDAVINFTADNLTLNLPYLEIDEGASVTFTGTGLATANITIGNEGLNIRNGATLNIGNATVNVIGQGAINRANTNGVIASNGGSISIVNTSLSPNNLYFAGGASLASLKIDNSNLATLTVHDSIRITDKLEVTNGHLVTNGFIKLISDANNTAMIPKVGTTSTITGAVEYQRYWARSIGGYYYIGVPVLGQTLADWQTDFKIQGILGSNPTYWTNIYTFNEPTNTWSAMSNITNPVVPGHGIIALMFSSDFADGFIRFSNVGNPVYGTYNVPLTYTDRTGHGTGVALEDEGWQLVANPYACAIDLSKIHWTDDANGVGSAVYLWHGATNMYETWTPGLGSRVVASGQSFFVKADGSTVNPYIDFKEDHKEATNAEFLRTGELPNLLTFKMINQDSVADNFHIVVNETATFGFDPLYDAFKYKNSSHNLYASDSLGYKLAVHSIPALRAQDTLLLNIESAASKSYELRMEGLKSLEQPVNIYLVDRYLNTTRLLNEGDRIPFAIDKSTSASFGQRFMLLVGQPGVVKLKDTITKAGKAFKVPLSLGQLEDVAEMNIGVRFNASEFKLNGMNLLSTLPGLTVDTTFAGEGVITLSKNSGTGILTLPGVLELVEFEFTPLVHKTGNYSIRIDPASSVITGESAKYSVLVTDAAIDVRSLRKLNGNILDQKGRPFNNAIVQLNSDVDMSAASPVEGWYNFDIMDNITYDVQVAGIDPDYSNPDLLDLIQLSRYANGLEQIPSGQILYSSDLDNDGRVSDSDLVLLKSLILSKQDKHPGKTVFNPRSGVSSNKLAIDMEESPGAVSFTADADYIIDFLALRKGEVYQNKNSSTRENGNSVDILFDLIPDNRKYNILHLNLYMEKDMELSGFELHVRVENSDFEIIGVENLMDQPVFFNEFYDNTKHQRGLLWVSSEELSHTVTNEKPFLKLSLKSNANAGLLIDNILEVNSNSKVAGPGFRVNSINGIMPRNFNGHGNRILTLYPNPSNGELNVVINSNDEEDFKFMFINASGQILFEEVRHVYKGTNTINFALAAEQHYLAPGYYLIRTESAQWTDVKPFIIQH